MARTATVTLEFQNVIDHLPVQPQQLYSNACSNDSVTINSWRPTWIANVKENHKRFGPFKDHSVGELHGLFANQPAIIAGAGPSLKYNGHELKNRGKIPLVSCLHNFHFFEDQDIKVDYYVTLDAGEVTIEEVSEGGINVPEWYWDRTKNNTLLAYIGTSPRLLEKWQGKILFFTAPVPDNEYTKAVDDIEPFGIYVSNGGNVLGACMYIAKSFMGCNPIIYVGADFSFSYDKKFHGWDSKYDLNLGYVLKAVDVFGNKVLTWQSYMNFCQWFQFIAIKVPGIWINATEGGCFGSYPEGNIAAIKQMELKEVLNMYSMYLETKNQCEFPGVQEKKILF